MHAASKYYYGNRSKRHIHLIALNIAMIGGVIAAFPYLFWELWRFY